MQQLLFPGEALAAPLTTRDAAAQVAAAGRAYGSSRYADLGRVLPRLLAGLHTTAERMTGGPRETATTLLARAYVLASSLATKLGDDPVAWVLADRALVAARHAGDGITVAAATHVVAIAMRREGHHDGALSLLTTAADNLGIDRADAAPELIAAYGNLLCTAAYSSAQAGRGDATTYIDAAADAANRLGDIASVGGLVPFSRSTVAIYTIGVHNALGDSVAALDSVAAVQPSQLPNPERYGRYCVDTARAWTLHGRPDRAVQALLSAERHAPEEVNRPSVRDLVTTLLYAPTATPAGLRDLAARIGATAGK
jgi:hypothetical protein